jgi:DNA-binding MarR family transcriptional regulator
MARYETPEALIRIMRDTTVGLIRRDGPDLSARQLAVFLTCYTENELQTVRALARRLNVSKPAITRALDRLAEFDLIRRHPDPLDRRSVLIQRTQPGLALFRDIRGFVRAAGEEAMTTPAVQQPAERSNQPAVVPA